MVKSLVPRWTSTVVPFIAFIALILCILCPIIAGACGQQSFFCYDERTGKFTGVGTNGTLYRENFNATLNIFG